MSVGPPDAVKDGFEACGDMGWVGHWQVGCRVEAGGLVEIGDVQLGQGSDAIRVRTTLDDYESVS